MSFRGRRLFAGFAAATAAVAGVAASSAAASADTYLPPPTGVLTFTGHGWGHGIGMSQWGAYGAAQQGLSATQILDFYYPGTTPLALDPHTPVRLLLNTDDGVDLTVAPAAPNGALSFTDVATNTVVPLPATLDGAAVVAWRAAMVSPGATQLQVNAGAGFQPFPAGAPTTVSGIARFTSASGVVRLVNPNGTQDDERGSLDAVLIGGALRTVERVGLDDMLPGVLGKEMSATWPTAALQAQAVSARSYAAFQAQAHAAQPYDLSIPKDFAYEGLARYDASGTKVASWDDPRLIAAVSAYPGDVRSYNGAPIFAQFSSSDGGYTVAGTVNGSPVPYLVAKADPYDAVAANGHHTWTATVPVTAVTAAYPSIGNLVSITANGRDGNGEWGGRISTVTVTGTLSQATDSGSTFAAKLGLQSPWWNLPGQSDPVGALESVLTAPGGAHITGWASDPKTTSAIAVHVYVDNKLAEAVPASVNRLDLAGELSNGTTHGFSAGVALTPGPHSVCVYAINSQSGGKNPQLGCATVQAYAGAPIGAMSVTPAIGGAQVSGWALDPDSVDPVSVRVTIDGGTANTVVANAANDTVAAKFPFYGVGHGLTTLLPISGTHSVCLTAVGIGAGGSTSFGCQTVTVYAGSPIGYLDAVIPQPGSVALWGWAIDPDTVAPIPVHLYVDGQLLTGVAATQSRPDVGAAFPVYGGAHGYSAVLPLSAGQHTVCAWALNSVGAGGNPRLGCKTVTVPNGDPVGHLDGVAYSGQVVAWGWAADPKQPSAPLLVHIYVDGALTTLGPATLPRPDVAQVFPAFGPAHGFFVAVPASHGAHRVCAFAINTLAGGNNPALGCSTITVP